MNGFVIAGTNSGCGKTTITMGLLALLAKHGYKVAPFKAGPDFIDPAFHARVAKTKSYNLDQFLMSTETIQHLYVKHSVGKDVAVVEGVMGLYDGMGDDAVGSTAQLSKSLQLPVILVVNCKSLYQSVAAIVKGFASFDTDLNVAGVILNHVNSADSYAFLKKYIEKQTGIKCVGYLPTNHAFALESRHLGLVQANEIEQFEAKVERLVAVLEASIDMNLLVEIASTATKIESIEVHAKAWNKSLEGLQLAVAMDDAFRFYYQDNLELLIENGAEIHYFSPLTDSCLPPTTNAIYIGGGYPEVFASKLAANTIMLSAIKEAAENGMPIFAECGGLMYLTEGIFDLHEQFHAMVGVFNCQSKMTNRLQHFGYNQVEIDGCMTRSHEFHRSQLVEIETEKNYKLQYNLSKPESKKEWTCGLQHKNVLAGYAHFHFWSEPSFFKKITDLWMHKTI